MLPAEFSAKYPFVARGLLAMRTGAGDSPNRDDASRASVVKEIAAIEANGESVADIARSLFDPSSDPDYEAVINFGTSAYYHLGVSDQIRHFVSLIWSSLVEEWPESRRVKFLYAVTNAGGGHRQFEALAFSHEVFRRVEFDPGIICKWVIDAQKTVGNTERSLVSAVETYCKAWPQHATILARQLIASRPSERIRFLVACILAWLRALPTPTEPVSHALGEIDRQLQAGGSAEARVMFIESWAYTAGLPVLTENIAVAIRDRLVTKDAPEETAWCLLLASAMGDVSKVGWVFRELSRLARPNLPREAKKWIAIAALHGWKTSVNESSANSRAEWENLLFAVAPFTVGDAEIWDQLETFLVEAFEKWRGAAHACALRLAEVSGTAWASRIEDRDFVWLGQRLTQLGAHERFVTELCLSESSAARRLGLKFFEICAVGALQPELVSKADSSAIELILLEAASVIVEPKVIARLHACLTRKVSELGDALSDWFYDEVATQGLNTNAYREAMAQLSGGDEYVTALLADVNDRLTETANAANSPALQMQVPGRDRAEAMAGRYMAREVGKGVKKYSVLSSLFTTVNLLYGKRWRMVNPDGTLSPASNLQLSSVSMELPRMEFLAPEDMHLRRLSVLTRIKEIEAQREKHP